MRKISIRIEALLLALIISGCTITVGTRASETSRTEPSTIHVVRRGENLFRIACYYYQTSDTEEANRGVERIRAANNISGSILTVGQQLRIPGSSLQQPAFALTPPNPGTAAQEAAAPAPKPPRKPQETSGETAGQPPPLVRTGMFHWPVSGRVICRYGELGNKGIDILTPAGASVTAARAGRISFAGQTAKYGETIIIEHDNNFFTVYGHDISIRVRKDQHVRAGETIAEVPGGSQKQRYLHFEIRKGDTPQDPLLFLPDTPTPDGTRN